MSEDSFRIIFSLIRSHMDRDDMNGSGVLVGQTVNTRPFMLSYFLITVHHFDYKLLLKIAPFCGLCR